MPNYASAKVFESKDANGNIIFTDSSAGSGSATSGSTGYAKPTTIRDESSETDSVDESPVDNMSVEDLDPSVLSDHSIADSADAKTQELTSKQAEERKAKLFKKGLHDLTAEELKTLTEEELAIFVKRQEVIDEKKRSYKIPVIEEFDRIGGGRVSKVLLAPKPSDETAAKEKLKSKATAKRSWSIESVEIASPLRDVTLRSASDTVFVRVKTAPVSLQKAKLKAQLWMNGRLVTTSDRSMLRLPAPQRGRHELQVKLVDKNDKVKLTSAARVITFKR